MEPKAHPFDDEGKQTQFARFCLVLGLTCAAMAIAGVSFNAYLAITGRQEAMRRVELDRDKVRHLRRSSNSKKRKVASPAFVAYLLPLP
jgi:hypothetical protein